MAGKKPAIFFTFCLFSFHPGTAHGSLEYLTPSSSTRLGKLTSSRHIVLAIFKTFKPFLLNSRTKTAFYIAYFRFIICGNKSYGIA
jgi:hypothetical protein